MSGVRFSRTMFAVETSPTSQPARVKGTHGAGGAAGGAGSVAVGARAGRQAARGAGDRRAGEGEAHHDRQAFPELHATPLCRIDAAAPTLRPPPRGRGYHDWAIR